MRLAFLRVFAISVTFLAGCDSAMDPDAGRTDAARTDSGGVDSGGVDAGPFDAGMSGCGSLTLPALSYEDVGGGNWGSYFPIALAQPAGSTDLYVASQDGVIVIVRGGAILGTPFLDLSDDGGGPGLDRTDFNEWGGDRRSERGLLGFAFHPDYATNGRFFVYYTATSGGGSMSNVVAEYHASGDVADTGEVRRLMDIPDPESNHNGGMIAFGRDGFLYVGTGDGGGAEDRHGANGNGQDLNSALGKMHRLDVNAAAAPYAAPGNPFAAGGGLATIWAYGLRNPWRFSFDRMNGDLYIGDVGQYDWEEVDVQPGTSAGGENYGWARFEGFTLFRADVEILPTGATAVDPVLAYDHDGNQGVIPGLAVTGGYVYRGSAIPALQGWYLFGDYVGNFGGAPVAAFRYCEGMAQGVQQVEPLSGVLSELVSFGEDDSGELYMLGNSVIRITAP